MKTPKTVRLLLIASGLIALGVGAGLLFVPVPFHAMTGIALGQDVSLLNEVRASGGPVLAGGVLILSGAFVPRLAFTSTVIAAFIYLSYGLARILSMAVDGIPDQGLVQVMVLELVVGLVCAFALRMFSAERPLSAETSSAPAR